MPVRTRIHQKIGRIDLMQQFDFNIHRHFKHAYMELLGNPAIHEIEIGMQHLVTLDSAALGMLVLLRERAQKVNKSIVLSNATGYVYKLLEVANFDKLFQLRNAS